MSEVKNKKKKVKYYSGQYWCSGSYSGYPYYHNDGNCLRYSGNGPYCKLYRFSQGETQRLIKLELSMQQENEMIHDIRTFIDGLRNGNDELNLVRLNDVDFQNKMQELDDKFSDLYKKIYLVRFKGARNTDIIPESEEFFVICDEATGLAEKYSQKKATSLSLLEKYITADIVVLMLLIGYEFIKQYNMLQ
mgnify:CR=1 FL=1